MKHYRPQDKPSTVVADVERGETINRGAMDETRKILAHSHPKSRPVEAAFGHDEHANEGRLPHTSPPHRLRVQKAFEQVGVKIEKLSWT